jgi:hypothetical protein
MGQRGHKETAPSISPCHGLTDKPTNGLLEPLFPPSVVDIPCGEVYAWLLETGIGISLHFNMLVPYIGRQRSDAITAYGVYPCR